MSKKPNNENTWAERPRRSPVSEGYRSIREHEVQESAMQLVRRSDASLTFDESAHMTENPPLLGRPNVTKVFVMIISIVAYLVVLHADIQSTGNQDFLVQLGASTPLIPSIYRVSSMFLRLNVSSILDVLVTVVILAHQLMAAIALLQVMVLPLQCATWMPSVAVALLFFGSAVCITEISSAALSMQLQRASSTSMDERLGGPEQNAGPLI